MVLVVLLGLLVGRDALAFYNPQTGRWLSRDPINEAGFNHLTHANARFKGVEERNLWSFVQGNPVNRYDVNGLLGPTIPVAVALAAELALCIGPDFKIAHSKYEDSGDGFKHCWVSCRVPQEMRRVHNAVRRVDQGDPG